MYLKCLAQAVSGYRSFPLASLPLCMPSNLLLRSSSPNTDSVPPSKSAFILSTKIHWFSLSSLPSPTYSLLQLLLLPCTHVVLSLLDQSLACFPMHSLPLSTHICLATHCKILLLTIISCFTSFLSTKPYLSFLLLTCW